jgi:hypothetical protein
MSSVVEILDSARRPDSSDQPAAQTDTDPNVEDGQTLDTRLLRRVLSLGVRPHYGGALR